MTDLPALDRAGRRRSPATMPGYHAGRPPRNKGMQYRQTRPPSTRSWASWRHTGNNRHGFRLRAITVVLWRAGLRVQEALALTEHDHDPRPGSLVRRGLCRIRHNAQGRPSPRVGMDEWA
jgi:integrase